MLVVFLPKNNLYVPIKYFKYNLKHFTDSIRDCHLKT